MARGLNRGEVWLYTFSAPDKRRPVVILSRQEVVGLLHTVLVAPITSTIRGAPSEVIIGTEDGLKTDSAVNLDHVQTVEKAGLRTFVGTLRPERMRARLPRAGSSNRLRDLSASSRLFKAPRPESRRREPSLVGEKRDER